ncbi:MAG: FAD binding domain-containing protein [Nitrososphaerota archaeon]|nr:FAD binding domain-containing protein [Nitrososphaerota archaeon]MDG7051357.1 FAD binding domain-containing protein [Nitrososphaerota archaeon]
MSYNTPNISLPKFTYYKADNLTDALSLLKQYNGNARVLAGGIELFKQMRQRLIVPEHIIDIKGIEELRKIDVTDRGIEIGPAVTAVELQKSQIIRDKCPPLFKAAAFMGDRILQNSVTIGGNLTSGLPCTEGVPALMSMDSVLEVRSAERSRILPVSDLVLNIRKTTLNSDEIITKIIVPYNGGLSGGYLKLLNASEMAVANVAVALFSAKRKLRMAIGAVSVKPYYFDESTLGWKWNEPIEENIRVALNAIGSTIQPMAYNRVASAEYRGEIAKVLAARALKELFRGA